MCRKNLSNNKGAMLALKHMVMNNLSDKEISDELFLVYGHRWAMCTIARKRTSITNKQYSPQLTSTTTLTATLEKQSEDDTIFKLHNEGLDSREIQKVLKYRGIDCPLKTIEQMCSTKHYLSNKEAAHLINTVLESLLELWTKYKIKDIFVPTEIFRPHIFSARDTYRVDHERINKDTLQGTDCLGYEALEYLLITNATDKPMKKFWKPLYAKWFRMKYPGYMGRCGFIVPTID